MDSNKCYYFEKYTFTDGLFSNSIDATYIIHLEDNGRFEDIKRQINIYHPTSIVYILHNKGYKKCPKEIVENTSVQDLNHSNIRIFKHAKDNAYNNILILEDDFIFSPKLKLQVHIDNINTFISNNASKPFIFQLGTVPIALFPYNSYVYRTISIGNHAAIYSKEYREKMMNVDYMNKKLIWDWDILNNTYGSLLGKFAYYTPLCYQIFPMTDNRKNWDNFFMSNFLGLLKIDTNHEPGTSYAYIFAGIVGFLFFIAFLFVIFYISKCIYIFLLGLTIKNKRYRVTK
jgi:hypothetical protein